MKRLLTPLLALGTYAVFADVPGSQDSEVLDRYTGSTIVHYRDHNGVYDFLYGPVDKIKRDVSFESAVRLEGEGKKITYEMPRGVSRERAALWYSDQLDQLGATMLFQCEGPDCGRATIWASQVFRVPQLSAPSRQQTYAAYVLESDNKQQLIALYVVERGNKRVIAHLDEINPSESVEFQPNRGFVDRLAATGIAVIQDVEPKSDGSLASGSEAIIEDIAMQMTKLVARDVFVVCHIRAAGLVANLIEASKSCATDVAQQIAPKLPTDIKTLGVGPLQPAIGRKNSRVEIVVPSLLRQVSQQ